MEEAKHSLYKAQQELLAKVQAADVRERERAAELAAEATARRAQEAAQRAQQAQEAARLEARRREIEQHARQASDPLPVLHLEVRKSSEPRMLPMISYMYLGWRIVPDQYPDTHTHPYAGGWSRGAGPASVQ